MAFPGYKSMERFPAGEECFSAKNTVSDRNTQAWPLCDAREDSQRIIEAGGLEKFGRAFQHREQATLFFQFTIGATEFIEHMDTPGLEPREVIPMIHDRHLVGFRIPHAYLAARFDHEFR